MRIEIDTNALTATDRAVLAVLAGDAAPAVNVAQNSPAQSEEPKKPKAEPKAKPKPAPKAEPEPKPEEETTEAEPKSAEMKDAIKRATEMIAEGKSKTVKEVLGKIGVKRVSQLEVDQITEFLAATDHEV